MRLLENELKDVMHTMLTYVFICFLAVIIEHAVSLIMIQREAETEKKYTPRLFNAT